MQTQDKIAVTFDDMCQQEPCLLGLEQEIKSLSDDSPHWCANRAWYDLFESRLNTLVGWHARNPLLRTEAAYNLAFGHLYELLPGCRQCSCLEAPIIRSVNA
jgi:hypothetical protein